MQLSAHALKRMSQRALSQQDVELIQSYGQKRNRHGCKLSICTHRSKAEMLVDGISPQTADRLKGSYIVYQGDVLVTVAHCSKRLRFN